MYIFQIYSASGQDIKAFYPHPTLTYEFLVSEIESDTNSPSIVCIIVSHILNLKGTEGRKKVSLLRFGLLFKFSDVNKGQPTGFTFSSIYQDNFPI